MSWMHEAVTAGKSLPLLEAYGVVRSLSMAMHGGQAMVMPPAVHRRESEAGQALGTRRRP